MMRPINILLVEDNPADIDLTREGLKESKLLIKLSVVMDGVAALDFIHQRDPYQQMPHPDVILLDLNLPRKDGREVLQNIKGDAKLKRIPVVILTSSNAETDVVRSYDLGANCYVQKPLDIHSFQQIVQSIEQFWFLIVKLPPSVSLE